MSIYILNYCINLEVIVGNYLFFMSWMYADSSYRYLHLSRDGKTTEIRKKKKYRYQITHFDTNFNYLVLFGVFLTVLLSDIYKSSPVMSMNC